MEQQLLIMLVKSDNPHLTRAALGRAVEAVESPVDIGSPTPAPEVDRAWFEPMGSLTINIPPTPDRIVK